VLKGRYTAIIFSVVIHSVIFFLISRTIATPPTQKENKAKPIKSFLYVPPIKKVVIEPKVAIKETQSAEIKQEQEQQNSTPKKVAEEIKQEEIEKLVKSETQPSREKELAKPLKNKPAAKKTVSKYSALKQLDQLRNKLNEKMFENEAFEYNRPKTGSIMHGTSIPVPRSIVPLTREQKKAKNTTRFSDGLSVTKNDNGTCTIERDLSNVGIEGVTALSSVSCGISKDKKDFRLHMEKVLKKLGK